jgi:signal transduction histidine kinase
MGTPGSVIKTATTLGWRARFPTCCLNLKYRRIVVHQRDTNARRAAQVERQRQAEELARCNLRLEEFAYTAAHDLREPLRAISACTQMLIQQTQVDANAKQMANSL